MSAATNFDCQRKGPMKLLLASIGLATALALPAFAAVEWGFGTGSDPSGADVGSGTATIAVGAFGTGWHDGTTPPWSSFGASGFWDLGRNGTIHLAGITESGFVALRVYQWVDTGMFSGNLAYQVIQNGNVLLSGLLGPPVIPTPGWQKWSAWFNVTSTYDVVITAPNGGALIDRVLLTAVPEPATMIAGAMLLIPFGLSTWYALRRRKRTAGRP